MASQLNADNADKGFMRILICCLRITNAYIHNGQITNPTERKYELLSFKLGVFKLWNANDAETANVRGSVI